MALSMVHMGAGSKPATVIDVLHFEHWYMRATHTDAQVLGSRSMTAEERTVSPKSLWHLADTEPACRLAERESLMRRVAYLL